MAKKVLLKDENSVEILPITRGELILDSSGKQALHSDEFLATTSQPGLMSKEDKSKIDNISISTLEITDLLPNGKKIATVSVGSTSYNILAPASYNWSEINNKPTNLSQFTDDVVAGKYLSLSGGTLNGALTISGNSLMIDMSDYGNAQAKFKNMNGTGLLIYVKEFDWRFVNEDFSEHKYILHSGNFSNYALPKDGTAVAATKLATPRTIWGQSFDGTGDVNGIFFSTGAYGGFALYGGIRENEAAAMEVLDSNGSWKSHGITLLQNGNVGIGGVTASEKLEVHGNVKANKFTGNIDGTYVNKLTGYTKAATIAAIIESDSLNTALGKLELKADTTYELVKGAYDGDGTIENLAEILKVLEGIKDTETIQAIVGKYLPLVGGTLTGNLTATKFITTGGTSSQFVKGDGSLDSNTYITTANSPFKNHGKITSSTTLTGLTTGIGYTQGYDPTGVGAYDYGELFTLKGTKQLTQIYFADGGRPYITATWDSTKLSSRTWNQIAFTSDIPTSLKNPNKLTLSAGTFAAKTYDGSSAVTVKVPTHTSHLTNDSGYITSYTDTAAGKTFKTLSSKSHSGWTNNTTDDKIIPTMSFIAYWNGAYASSNASNLTYSANGIIIGSSNYTDYTVKKDGTGATGTWEINVTGSAAYLPVNSGLTTETGITESGLRAYSGSGSGWTGSVTSMAYAGILALGKPSRGFQMWACRGTGNTGNLRFRVGNQDANAWETERIILDNVNWASYISIPTITNYYWANVPISATSNSSTSPTFANATTTGLLTVSTGGSHCGIKAGNTYINSINSDLIFQNNGAIRFGGDSWDYNVWAGLKYVHSSKTISLGLADGTHFTANSAQSGGTMQFPGIGTFRLNGTVHINPPSGSYVEGIRMHPSSAGWTALVFCGDDNTADSGTSAKTWGLFTNGGNFYINKNNSNVSTGYELCNVSGNWGIGTTDPNQKLSVNGAIYTMQPSTNRRAGIIGTYDANRAAAIWSMGSSYQIAADGTTFGNLYGAAYAYFGTGYTFGSGKSGGHSFVWCQNGTPCAALGDGIWTKGGLTAENNQTLYGLTSTCNAGNDASYTKAAVQIREYNFGGSQSDTWAIAPRLAWHWSGRVQAQIGLGSDNHLYISEDGNFTKPYEILHAGSCSRILNGIYLPTIQVTKEQASNDDWIKTHALDTLRGHVYNNNSLEWQYLFGISSSKSCGSILRTTYGDGYPRLQVMGLYNGSWTGWREAEMEKIATASPTPTSVGWYRCAHITTSNAMNAGCVLISLQRNYNSPQNEHYIFAISIGYNGQVSISQLSGCVGGQRISKVRVVWNNSGNCYFDYYMETSNYTNGYRVRILSGDCVSYQSPTLVSEAGGNVTEFSTVNGMKSNYGFTGDLYGKASSVTVGDSNSNSTYRMVWHDGNALYGTGGIYCNPSTDYLYATSVQTSDWFRSSGDTGWYSQTHGGGWYMTDSAWIRNYNSKPLYISVSTYPSLVCNAQGGSEANIRFEIAGANKGYTGYKTGYGTFLWNSTAAKYVYIADNGYFYTQSYINVGSGNEKNESNPPYVWGVNGSDNFMRTYATSSLSVNYASSAGSASTASSANGLASTGYGSGNLTYYQSASEFFGNSGWSHYIIANHGDGSSYYNYTIALPFWDVPKYKRLEGGTEDGWHTFVTSENYTSYLGYIGTTAVQSTSNTQALTGISRINNSTTAHLYLGNSGNQGWVMTQDICSHSGSGNWAINVAGNSWFKQVNIGYTYTASGSGYALNISGNAGISGNVYATAYYESSDIRLKNFIKDVSVDLNKIRAIPKKYFTWKKDTSLIQIGTSAQAVQKLYPELVSSNTNGYLSVDYSKLSVIALKGIDELYDMILELRAENRQLREQIRQLQK